MVHGIIAGDVCDIKGDKGHWLIVDIGFSSTQPSCGVWNGAGEPKVFTFGDLVALTTHEVQADDPGPLNLLIEAPLSVAFRQNGNPIRRNCDICDGMRREWYVNAGAATLVAAGYLLRAIHGCQRQREVKLFEGFASFRRAKNKPGTDAERREADRQDVLALRNAVWNRENATFFAPGDLVKPGHHIESAFSFLDENPIPPVIRINPDT